MRFSILGPLSAEIGEHPVDIDRPRRRSVLAYLLLQANRPVTTDQLVAAVWGDHPVRTAPTQVHAAVSALRRTFRRAGAADLIDNRPTGYLIRLNPEQLDVAAFGAAVAAARTTPSTDGTCTIDDLRHALDLWRGQALEAINGAFVEAARARLEEERLLVFERLMDLEIANGNYRGITPELMGFIELHPLRESLLERLMLALYHSGRKSDALREYALVRRRLAAELGVEPGPDLRRLHLEILQDGPAARPRPAPQREGSRSPRGTRRLPPASTVFTGRAAERAQLRYALAGRPRESAVVALHGPGGVGKSTLAIQVAHDLSADFPDGQLYIDLQGSTPGLRPLTGLDVLRRCLRGLGLPEADIPADEIEATQRYRELSEESQLLIVLDNATDTRQVETVIRAGGSGGQIITSRTPLALPESALALRIDALPPADAISLLDRIAGRTGSDWSAFGQIAAYCDYLPLALCIAAGRLAREPDLSSARLADSLADHRNRLDTLEIDGVGVRSSIRVGYDLLASGSGRADHAAAEAFCALGLLPMPTVEVGAVAAMLRLESTALASTALNRLARAQLISLEGDDRYRLHDIVRATAAGYAEEALAAGHRAELRHRGIAFYAACAVLAEDLLRPARRSGPDRLIPSKEVAPEVLNLALRTADDVGPWLDATLPNLIAVAQVAAADAETARYTVAIAAALSWVLRKRGEFHREYALATSAVTAAERMAEPAVLRQALIQLGRVELYLADYRSGCGHIDRALASARDDGDAYVQISALNDLGLAAIKQGDFPAAKRLLLECIDLVAPTADRVRVGVTALHNLAVVEALLGRWREAVKLLRRTLRLRRSSTDRAGEGSDLVLLGVVCCGLGVLDEAARYLDEGIGICEDYGDRVDTWFGLSVLTLVHLRQGRQLEATVVGQRCLLAARGLGQPFAEKSAHLLIARAHDAAGESGDARAHDRRAAAIEVAPSAPEAKILHALMS